MLSKLSRTQPVTDLMRVDDLIQNSWRSWSASQVRVKDRRTWTRQGSVPEEKRYCRERAKLCQLIQPTKSYPGTRIFPSRKVDSVDIGFSRHSWLDIKPEVPEDLENTLWSTRAMIGNQGRDVIRLSFTSVAAPTRNVPHDSQAFQLFYFITAVDSRWNG